MRSIVGALVRPLIQPRRDATLIDRASRPTLVTWNAHGDFIRVLDIIWAVPTLPQVSSDCRSKTIGPTPEDFERHLQLMGDDFIDVTYFQILPPAAE